MPKLRLVLRIDTDFVNMFTGIIEDQAEVLSIKTSGTNKIFYCKAKVAQHFRIDESIAHNGVCLTVEKIDTHATTYQVTAIEETLSKTMLAEVQTGQFLNLERALKADSRLDGHFVQGHVDGVGEVVGIDQKDGSTDFTIRFPANDEALIIGRGSICINGISLTIAHNDEQQHTLTVSIIPHTIQQTNIDQLEIGQAVNLEYDVLGKYVQKLMAVKN